MAALPPLAPRPRPPSARASGHSGGAAAASPGPEPQTLRATQPILGLGTGPNEPEAVFEIRAELDGVVPDDDRDGCGSCSGPRTPTTATPVRSPRERRARKSRPSLHVDADVRGSPLIVGLSSDSPAPPSELCESPSKEILQRGPPGPRKSGSTSGEDLGDSLEVDGEGKNVTLGVFEISESGVRATKRDMSKLSSGPTPHHASPVPVPMSSLRVPTSSGHTPEAGSVFLGTDGSGGVGGGAAGAGAGAVAGAARDDGVGLGAGGGSLGGGMDSWTAGVAASLADSPAASSADSPAVRWVGYPFKMTDLINVSELGTGQNGTVMKAFFLPKFSVVAVKTIDIYNKSMRHQLEHELDGFLSRPGVSSSFVEFVGASFVQGSILLVLECMNRGSLYQQVLRRGPVPEPALRSIAKQVTRALRALHQRHMVHRDVKPENMLVSHDGRVKLSDFGLFKDLGDAGVCKSFVGTLSYLSPERITGGQFSYPSDVWSLGIALVFCATGELPLPRDYWALVAHLTDPNTKPPSLDPARFSPELCSFVGACLEKDPEKRMTADQLYYHPFVRPAGADQLVWPYAEPSERDVADLAKVLSIVVQHFYPDGQFHDLLIDRDRLKHLSKQVGVPLETVTSMFLDELRSVAERGSLGPSTPLKPPASAPQES